jgi:hypothetical protein
VAGAAKDAGTVKACLWGVRAGRLRRGHLLPGEPRPGRAPR